MSQWSLQFVSINDTLRLDKFRLAKTLLAEYDARKAWQVDLADELLEWCEVLDGYRDMPSVFE